jgi:TMEM175 potassium channel family protein
MDSRRAEAFSDGVFAVAITLLIFNLLPIGAQGKLTYRKLGSEWPQYAAYVVSFLTIGIMWMNHHTLFGHVRRIDRPLLVFNLLLLMGVVAIPFPTALIAEHLGAHKAGGSVAAVIYGLVMIVISIFYNVIWEYLVRHAEALGSPGTRQALRDAVPGFGSGPGLAAKVPRWSLGLAGYTAGVLIAAFWSAGAALAVYGALAVYYLFNHLPDPVAVAEMASRDREDDGSARPPMT